MEFVLSGLVVCLVFWMCYKIVSEITDIAVVRLVSWIICSAIVMVFIALIGINFSA